MPALSESREALLQAIEKLETALELVDEDFYPLSAFLITQTLDQLRADAWPDAIASAPSSH